MPSAAVCISCISIHALCEEGDLMVIRVPPRYSDFYPRPLRGGRLSMVEFCELCVIFLSTPSARRATHKDVQFYAPKSFLSTPSARRATQPPRRAAPADTISIHALCEEGD